MTEEAVLAVLVSPQDAFPSPSVTAAQGVKMTSSRAIFLLINTGKSSRQCKSAEIFSLNI